MHLSQTMKLPIAVFVLLILGVTSRIHALKHVLSCIVSGLRCSFPSMSSAPAGFLVAVRIWFYCDMGLLR